MVTWKLPTSSGLRDDIGEIRASEQAGRGHETSVPPASHAWPAKQVRRTQKCLNSAKVQLIKVGSAPEKLHPDGHRWIPHMTELRREPERVLKVCTYSDSME